MKILHVIAQLPVKTGSGVYFSNVIEEMKKYGHEQAALFASQDGFNFDALNDNAQYPVYFKTDKIPFPIVGMSDVMPYENTVYSQMSEDMLRVWHSAFDDALRRAKTEFKPDIVILHHLWILSGMAAEIFAEAAKVGVCHNTDIRQAKQHPAMKNKYVKNLQTLDMVFCLGNEQKREISRVFGIEHEKLITIGGGFNQRLFYPTSVREQGETVRVVFSAKIERSKGVFELVKAFKRISKIKPNVRLDIIGTPNEENARVLSTLTEDLENIAVVPIKCQKELAEYIRDKDIFVMPSYFEGLGLMAVECLACGLRVVATEIEALMSLLGDDINESGVIEYVSLPRLYDTDKPFAEDTEDFVERLHHKLLLQIERVEAGALFPQDTLSEIGKHSWGGVTERINSELMRLAYRQFL